MTAGRFRREGGREGRTETQSSMESRICEKADDQRGIYCIWW